ncbi:MAG: TIGR03087 family PEP-CTERM/XrtA system glycosyltransferase [Pirellulaceae bacterium]
MKRAPHILFIAHRVPYPPNRGDRIRSFHILKFLTERCAVSLAYLTDEPPPRETTAVLESLCHQVVFDQLRGSRWLYAAAAIASGRTATEGLFTSTKLRTTIGQWAADTSFDAVFVYCSSMVQYLNAPGLSGVPTVVDLVDIDSQKWFDYAKQAHGPKRLLLRIEANRLRHLEASLSNRVDAVTVVADREADLFRSFVPYRPHVIRNGVDLDYFQPSCSTGDCRLTALFVGALDYDANIDGVTWFCDEVWPHVLKRFPQAVFRLVGSRPDRRVRRLGSRPGVTLIGEVPDVRPYMQDAAVITVPLRVARGIQNKVLEAMAAGKPVVVTPQALDGIKATPDVDLIRAATPTDWIESITKLFIDPQQCARLGHTGRAFVEEEYRWPNQLAKLCQLPGLMHCLGERRASGSCLEPIVRSPQGSQSMTQTER